MELVNEVGALRKELENLKQQLVLMQNTSNDPSTVMHVLNEMTNLSVGPPLESIILSAISQDDGKHPSLLEMEERRCNDVTSNRGAEFAAELDRMPILPGDISPVKIVEYPVVTTEVFENMRQPDVAQSPSSSSSSSPPPPPCSSSPSRQSMEISGCIFNQ
jgi:hypothetical protein